MHWLNLALQILNTLLIDIFDKGPSTVQAASNLVRCLVAAGGLAILDFAIKRIGVGYTFTVIAAFSAVPIPLLLLQYVKGLGWRRARNSAGEAPAA